MGAKTHDHKSKCDTILILNLNIKLYIFMIENNIQIFNLSRWWHERSINVKEVGKDDGKLTMA